MSENSTRLSTDQLRRRCDVSIFDFKSTEELPPLDEVVGQERAVRAATFGIEIERPGYHLYALGPAGTGKTTTVMKFLEGKAAQQPVPDDWCYVNNFEDPDKPLVLPLPAGKGLQLQKDMEDLVQELETELPRVFDSEQYRNEREQIQEEHQKRQEELMGNLQRKAEEKDLALVQTAQGLLIAPLIDGEPMPPQRWGQLDEGTRQKLEARQKEIQEEMRETRRRVQALQREARQRIRELDRQVVSNCVAHVIDDLIGRYREQEKVAQFLKRVRKDILDNVRAFKQLQEAQKGPEQMMAGLGLPGPSQGRPTFDQYRVNLLVDHSRSDRAPVVLETYPTYYNLVGRIEHQAQYGALVTNFRMIKSGALHRANGGYLIVETLDLLTKPFAWETLKRALRNQEVKIELMGEEFRLVPTRSLEPEPIPLSIKVVMIGDPLFYYLLYNLDEDFRELFRVKADFGTDADWTDEMAHSYARFIGNVCREEGLTPFEPPAVGRVVEYGSRQAGDQTKVATKFGEVVDLIREADYWARKNGNGVVTAQDVQKAIEEKIYRSNRLEELIQRLIHEGTLLIDTEGEVVGQINGISVVPLGDYSFGKPSRITARTYVGSEGLINIDRETRLGGPLHNKGVLILTGYLGGKFAQDIPLALSASITFEQLYEEVEGDSASSAELYALLSSLSDIPARQGIAVTGSVNQRGQVQAIGGVNEKVEGFFKVCKLKGLTGSQGVLIPKSNVKNLMLQDEVVDAVREGRFHIWAVSTIDEGIEILTGVEAATVNAAAQKRLRELAEKVRAFVRQKEDKPQTDS